MGGAYPATAWQGQLKGRADTADVCNAESEQQGREGPCAETATAWQASCPPCALAPPHAMPARVRAAIVLVTHGCSCQQPFFEALQNRPEAKFQNDDIDEGIALP